MSWTDVQVRLTPEQMNAVVEEAARDLIHLPFAVLRNRRELGARANQAVQAAVRRLGLPQPTASQLQAMAAQVVARVGGLGFLDALLPPNTHEYTDIAVNPDGTVWVRRKGQMSFERLDIRPTVEEVWRAVDALLAPVGRACTEATPVVDARLPRDPEHGFAGARINVTHPVITPGEGYPAVDIRLYEPRPVPPEQIVAWGMMPQGVMEGLLAAVAKRLRLMVIGGTSTGKTTLLSALCHGIPRDARIVTIEDPQEIWLPHPNVETLEARHAPPGSDVRPFTVADGVDVALRKSPSHIIVGEVRDGRAALALFRALMTDHAGMTTFHAEGPDEAVHRMSVILFADAQVRADAAKGLFYRAVDWVVQVGWRNGERKLVGVWEVAGYKGGNVKFRPLWEPGEERLREPEYRRERG